LILLAFFLPLAFYVLVLGIINRRPHPLMVSASWDFVGILFAASGFLVFGGPFVISTLNETWRNWLLLGPRAEGSSGDSLWVTAIVLSVLYFAVIVAGAAFMLWLLRKQTVIYNIDLLSFEESLAAACARLGLRPSRSGTSYLFDPAKDLLAATPEKKDEDVSPARLAPRQLVLMDVDYFRAMRHVTLRWSAADSLLRKEIEAELAQQLSETLVSPSNLGAWLTVLAFGLLGLSFLVGFGVLVYRIMTRV
jgi:hypothetical protein